MWELIYGEAWNEEDVPITVSKEVDEWRYRQTDRAIDIEFWIELLEPIFSYQYSVFGLFSFRSWLVLWVLSSYGIKGRWEVMV